MIAVRELGGDVIEPPADVALGGRESIEDVARNLERWVFGVVVRTFAQERLERFAAAAPGPARRQRADRRGASLPGAGRLPDADRAVGLAARPDGRVRRRRQQRRGVARAGGRDARRHRRRRVAEGIRAAGRRARRRWRAWRASAAACAVTNDPVEAVARAGRGLHRRLGVDGPGERGGSAARASSRPIRSTPR